MAEVKEQQQEDEFYFKIVVIGDSGVGKSCLLRRFSEDSFSRNEITTTGVDFKMVRLDIEGRIVKLQIWDTAGQERFRSITDAYYRGAAAIIIVYDITVKASLDNIKHWISEANSLSIPNTPILILGNKCDRDKRVVTYEQGAKLAKELNAFFLETSAKNSVNVKEAFSLIISKIFLSFQSAQFRLHSACSTGKLNIVKQILETQKEEVINQADTNGQTALHIACKNGTSEIVQMLLKSGSEKNKQDKTGQTPLSIACNHGSLETVKHLLQFKADCNLEDSSGLTPLLIACRNGSLEIAKQLLNSNANLNVLWQDWTPLMLSFSPQITELLITKGSPINQTNKKGWTALLIQSFMGRIQNVNILVQNGANVNTENNKKLTPLLAAVRNGHLEMAEILLKSNANIEKADYEGNTPLHIASFYGFLNVAVLLLQNKAKVDSLDKFQWTPLFSAIQGNHFDIVKLLIENKSPINIYDKIGWSPLHLACSLGLEEITQLLLNSGAEKDIQTLKGETPLFVATSKGHFGVIKLLIKSGSNVNKITKAGFSPLHVAAIQNHCEIAKFLLNSEADSTILTIDGFTPMRFAEDSSIEITNSFFLVLIEKLHLRTEFADTLSELEKGSTPLCIASEKGFKDLVVLLLRNGSNLNKMNAKEQTPLFIACLNGHWDCCCVLAGAGGSIPQKFMEDARNAIGQENFDKINTGIGRFVDVPEIQTDFKGDLTFPPGYQPKLGCKDELLASLPYLVSTIPQLQFILDRSSQFFEHKIKNPAIMSIVQQFGLTPDEVYSLILYSFDLQLAAMTIKENFYYQINDILRTRKPNDISAIRGYLWFAQHALQKLPNFSGTVYRGNSNSALVKSNYLQGSEVFWSGFTSTTTSLEIAKRFAMTGVVFRICIHSGKDISAFSCIPSEQEILLPPNSKLFVSKGMSLESDNTSYVELLEKSGAVKW